MDLALRAKALADRVAAMDDESELDEQEAELRRKILDQANTTTQVLADLQRVFGQFEHSVEAYLRIREQKSH